jgi:hypothetical protein
MSTDRYATFRSGYFDNKTPKPHFINPNCFGEDLAAWLRDGLGARFEPGGIIQEDYGWGFWTNANGDPYWVSVQLYNFNWAAYDRTGVYVAEDPGEWLLSVGYDAGLNFLRPLFRRPKAHDLLSLCRALDDHLNRAGDVVHNIEWWQKPQVGTPTAHPV